MHLLRLLLTLILLYASCAFGTAQQTDRLIVDGKEESLATNPLDPWLAKHPGRLPQGAVSSANWRGYVATWEISGDALVLRKVTIERGRGDHPDVLADLFPDQQRVTADWYSGMLTVRRGELLNYVHLGYASTYESYLLFRVRDGKVVKQQAMNAEEFTAFRKKQFEGFRKTAEFETALQELLDSGSGSMSRKEAIMFLFDIETEKYLSMDYASEPQGGATTQEQQP